MLQAGWLPRQTQGASPRRVGAFGQDEEGAQVGGGAPQDGVFDRVERCALGAIVRLDDHFLASRPVAVSLTRICRRSATGPSCWRWTKQSTRIADTPVDRGHLIPHLSGGEFGPNIFRQDRRLNQGPSEEGRRYRAREREAAAIVGALHFGHLLYSGMSDYPVQIETALLLPGDSLHVDQFDNRPQYQT